MHESRKSMNAADELQGSALDWLAFQYVAGELPPAEYETFELQLSEDQQAREAVARAVQMVGTLSTARSAPATRLPQSSQVELRSRRLAGIVCVAVLVLLAVSLRLLQKPASLDESARAEQSRVRTVSDWVALGPSDDEPAADDLELSFNDTEQIPKVDTPADDLAVPSWMVAALEHDHDDLVEED